MSKVHINECDLNPGIEVGSIKIDEKTHVFAGADFYTYISYCVEDDKTTMHKNEELRLKDLKKFLDVCEKAKRCL